MQKTIISIDPGSKGFITVINPKGAKAFLALEDNDQQAVSRFLDKVLTEANCYEWGVIGVMEEVHAILGSSAKGTFSFGRNFGFLQGLFVGKHIPFHLVQPKEWQNEIWINQDKVYESKKDKKGVTRRMVDTKKTSINAAIRLFPDVDLRKTPQCRNIDDNKADSLLINEFARRKNI